MAAAVQACNMSFKAVCEALRELYPQAAEIKDGHNANCKPAVAVCYAMQTDLSRLIVLQISLSWRWSILR